MKSPIKKKQIKLLIMILALVALVEMGIMLVFTYVFPDVNPLLESFIDTLTLTLVITPALWKLLYREEQLRASIEHQLEDARSSATSTQEVVSQLAETLNESNIVCITDRKGIIRSVNNLFCQISGFTQEEVCGKTFRVISSGNHDPGFFKELWEKIEEGKKWHGVFCNKNKKGEVFYLESTIMPFTEIGTQEETFLAVSHDVTDRVIKEQKLKEATLQAKLAVKAKSEFLANMSHEIRTPMNAVIGMTGLLLDTHLSELQREFTSTIRTASEQLLSIINDILDFSKIESGELQPEKVDLDLRSCIESSLDLVAMSADENGIELLSLVESDVPNYIVGDETRIRQVLVNLLNNAVKFSHRGGEVILRIFCTGEETDKSRKLVFEVADNGIGIAESHHDKLFQVFSQVDTSTTRKYGGTGLGLAICKRLVQLMGGEIGFTSKEGEGSTFRFEIPWIPSSYRETGGELHASRSVLRDKDILIVDDSPANCRVLSLQLSTWGAKSTSFNTPEEAIVWLLKGNKPDLIITDYQMPSMDGSEFARLIKNNPTLEPIPIIMLTSLGNPTPEGSSVVSVVLHKPIKSTHLKISLEKLLLHHVEHPEIQGEQPIPKLAASSPADLLVAEDNPINQKVIRLILERLGYFPDIVSNGEEVLEIIKKKNYDIILMDAQMPVMDGLEAMRRIHKIMSPQDRPVIIVLTAHAKVGDKELFLEAGMDMYLSKPIDIHHLIAALSKAVIIRKKRTSLPPDQNG